MIVDAHLHIRKIDVENNLLNIIDNNDLYVMAAGMTPEDCAWLKSIAKQQERIIPTYGLHPWYADQHKMENMINYLESCVIIGEIGMDSVWCKTDLDIQRKIFIAQMDIAQERGCPVILHTKGQEAEIAEIISDYSIPKIVHWFSSEENLDLYVNQDCYFTVGPDVYRNKAVQKVVKNVQLNRLLVESDGISALEWAIGRAVMPDELPGILQSSINYIARVKGINADAVRKEMENTFIKLIRNGNYL